MRLFFAIDIPKQQKIAIHNWREKAFGQRAAIPSVNFHLTLLFLGQATNRDCENLIAAANQVTFSPLTLITSGVGYFSKPKVSWLGVNLTESLQALHSECRHIAKQHHLNNDKNSFTPHISLYRHEKEPPAPLFDQQFEFTATSFGLFESQSTPSGVRYHCIESFSANRR